VPEFFGAPEQLKFSADSVDLILDVGAMLGRALQRFPNDPEFIQVLGIRQ